METWLRCTVFPGQFSNEFAIVIRQSDGADASLFVPKELVEHDQAPQHNQPAQGWLPVRLVDQKGNAVLVHLPRQTLENGQYVTVNADQLRSKLPQPA